MKRAIVGAPVAAGALIPPKNDTSRSRPNGVSCRNCGGWKSIVKDSRGVETQFGGMSVRRRRECVDCGFRFTSYEITDAVWESIVAKINVARRPIILDVIRHLEGLIAGEGAMSLERGTPDAD